MTERVAAPQPGIELSPTAGGGRRLDFLDALRGLASAYVVLFHLRYVGGVEAPSSLSTFISYGATGVMLFFVVSAFSLFYTMPARYRQPRPYFAFYVHRFFRIAPLFYLWLVVETTLNATLYHYPTTIPHFIENVLFIFNLAPGNQAGIVMASWTIGVEMLFYLMFPLVYLATKSLTHAVALTIGSGLVYSAFVFVSSLLPISPASAGDYASWIFLKDLPVFALGAVCFFVVRRANLSPAGETDKRALGGVLLMIGVGVMLARSANWVNDGIFGGHPYIWPGIGYSLILVGLSFYPIGLLVNRITKFLGKVSYSLYLAHAPIILLFAHLNIYSSIVAHLGPHLGYVTSLAFTFAVALAIAYLTYRLIELPSIQLGKRFYARAIRRRTRSAVAQTEASQPRTDTPGRAGLEP